MQKPVVPVLKDACVRSVADPIKKTTPSEIWQLFVESRDCSTDGNSNNGGHVAASHKHRLYKFMEKTFKEKDGEIEYDMDDEVKSRFRIQIVLFFIFC